jgi:hypothetical protein
VGKVAPTRIKFRAKCVELVAGGKFDDLLHMINSLGFGLAKFRISFELDAIGYLARENSASNRRHVGWVMKRMRLGK